MSVIFYISALVAVLATIMVVTRANAIHALLYLIVSLLAVALIFYTMGAPFVAALEVIIYAGAIVVLLVFAIMLLNLGPKSEAREKQWLASSSWAGPMILAAVLLGELMFLIVAPGHTGGGAPGPAGGVVSPQQFGLVLYGPYALGVELASILLLAGLVGAFHLGRRRDPYQIGTRKDK